ncbi:MAG TPA: DUF3048 domain-containing protein [Acidimicrobiales bacterium]|nr:DUF3048 domain-containing protein [Acidimicrobiales bacterium]
MPDETTPEQPGDVPKGVGGDDTGVPEPWDRATQAVPADTGAGDVTQAVPADTTRSMASAATPPVGTPVTAAAGAAAATGPDGDAAGGRARNSSQRAWVIALVAVAVLVVGSGIALAVTAGGGTKKKASGAALNIPVVTTTSPSGPLCPLTGLPAPGGHVPQRPALAVKIDNYPQARPQSGLGQADIVFDEPVEGLITRFAAVFQCQSPALIGPIRSARAVDLQILDQLSRPILVHVGGIGPVLSLLQSGNLIDFDLRTHGSIVQTVPGRYAPYDTYISAAAGWGLDAGYKTPPSALFTYSTATPSGTPTMSVHIPFSGTNNVLWTWNASSGHWLLSYSGEPALLAGGGQITTTNIVVQTVHVTYGPWLENSEGGLEVQSQMTGSGPLTVLRNGVAVTGTWQRSSIHDPTTLTASDGSPIALAPGQTWVEIVPSTVAVTTTPASAVATTRP